MAQEIQSLEAYALALTNYGDFSSHSCLELLRAFALTRGTGSYHLRPVSAQDVDAYETKSVAVALGVYRHGGLIGVSDATNDFPELTK